MMFAVVGTVLLGAVLYWLIFLRPHSKYGARPFIVSRGLPENCVADFVVIGAGPGGLAAAQRLLSWNSSATVLILERGEDLPFSTGPFDFIARCLSGRHLLWSAPNLVGSHIDAKWRVHRPLYLCGEGREPKGSDSAQCADALQAYPRGCCVDGTAALDWGIWFPPLFPSARKEEENKEENKEEEKEATTRGRADAPWAPPLRFPVLRSPLSWAFAEAAAALLPGAHHSATAAAPHGRNAVSAALLRSDAAGRRVPLACGGLLLQLLRGDKEPEAFGHRLRVATGCAAVRIDFDAAGRAVAVRCAGVRCAAAARRGVVLSAGVVGTARLLRGASPMAFATESSFSSFSSSSSSSFVVRDAIAVPLLLEARPGLSDDGRRTACGVCEVVAAADAPALGPMAEVLLALVPRGGRGAAGGAVPTAALGGLHVDRALAAFAEALTVVVVLRGAGAVGFEVSDEGPVASRPPPHEESEHKENENGNENESGNKNESGNEKESGKAPGGKGGSGDGRRDAIVAALAEGLRLCRRIAAEPPLAHLTTGRTAVDAALLPCRRRAIEYTRLTRTPRAKRTARQREAAQELLAWAEEAASTEEYMEKYIRRHAVWMGFGSGSSERALEDGGKSLRVRGTTNVFVGDCSAATGAGDDYYDELRAGSVATAVAMGQAAADELLRTLAEEETGMKSS